MWSPHLFPVSAGGDAMMTLNHRVPLTSQAAIWLSLACCAHIRIKSEVEFVLPAGKGILLLKFERNGEARPT